MKPIGEMMKKLWLIPLLLLLFACTPIGFPRDAGSTVTVAATQGGYEEGSWTPSVGGTATYTNQLGSYIKIGRFIRVSMLLTINVIGTGSQITVSGLPFTSAIPGGTKTTCPVSFALLAVPITYIVAELANNGTTISLNSTTVAAVSVASNAVMTSGTTIVLTCDYYTT